MTEILAAAGENPEFIDPSANPFYRLPTGKQSMYGDLLMVMLESLVACKGNRVVFLFQHRLCAQISLGNLHTNTAWGAFT